MLQTHLSFVKISPINKRFRDLPFLSPIISIQTNGYFLKAQLSVSSSPSTLEWHLSGLPECAHSKVFWEGLLRFRKQRLRSSSLSSFTPPSQVSDELSVKMSLFTIRLFIPGSSSSSFVESVNLLDGANIFSPTAAQWMGMTDCPKWNRKIVSKSTCMCCWALHMYPPPSSFPRGHHPPNATWRRKDVEPVSQPAIRQHQVERLRRQQQRRRCCCCCDKREDYYKKDEMSGRR